MSTLSTTLLTDLIRRKHDVLVELCAVGRRQREIVERGETTALLELLAAKQTMIALLQQVERDLAPFHAENPDQRIWAPPTIASNVPSRPPSATDCSPRSSSSNAHSAERLTVRRNDVAAQLRQVYAAGQARDAYEAQR